MNKRWQFSIELRLVAAGACILNYLEAVPKRLSTGNEPSQSCVKLLWMHLQNA